MFTGHIKVLGGPNVARGPDIAQAWYILTYNTPRLHLSWIIDHD